MNKRIFFLLNFLVSSVVLSAQAFKTCEKIPALNQTILNFVKSNLGKKVGDGECWSLAAHALGAAKAKWDNQYKFGKEIDLIKDCLSPGDIIQFEGVITEHSEKRALITEEIDHHTAIVYSIARDGTIMLADQNNNIHGKKTGLSPFNFKWITEGRFYIYRPQL